MKRYTTKPIHMADIEIEPDAEDYLSRTVFEDNDPIDTGLLDKNGNAIYSFNVMDRIGFRRFR